MTAPPVSLTVDQAREAMARIERLVSYAPEEGRTSTEQTLWAACNTIISQAQALSLLNTTLDDLEKEIATMRNMMKAVEDELGEARADLRALCGAKQ